MPESTKTRTDTDAIIEVTNRAAYAGQVSPGQLLQATTAAGEHVLLDTERYADRPRRVGPRKVETFDPAAFLDYITRYFDATDDEDDASTTRSPSAVELWSNVNARTVTAVLNGADGPYLAGWADHRAVLTLREDPQWAAWTKVSGQLMSQAQFAEFIEDQQDDFVDPAAATMLDLAQTFTAKKNVDFESSENLANGARGLLYKETVAARAGQKGQLEIPSTVELALRPFQGAQLYKVTARLRFRINDGHLQIGFKLHQPAKVLEAAFAEVVEQVNAGTPESLRVNHGIG